MIIELKHMTNDFLRSILIWTVFLIAVNNGLELLNINFYFAFLLLPGLLFSSFLIYYLLKTKRFLNYWSYIISIFIISLGFHLIRIIKLKFILLDYREDDLLKLLVMIVASFVVSSFLYLISYILKKIIKA